MTDNYSDFAFTPRQVLGLSPNAAQQEIEAARDQLSQALHPDRVGPGATTLRHLISHAAQAVAQDQGDTAWQFTNNPLSHQPVNLKWDSLLDTIAIGDLTIMPLTDSAQLREEGESMKHAVAYYDFFCQQGISRIFSIRRDEERIATGELRLREDRWTVSQVRAAFNRKPPKDADEAMEQIAVRYNEAYQDLQETETAPPAQ